MRATIVILTLVTSLILGSCGPLMPKQRTDKVVAVEKRLETIFDVPSLLNKNIDEIKQILGKPISDTEPTKLQLQMDMSEWDKTFEKGGYELLVTYHPKTRKVIDFFVGTADSSGVTSNYIDLLQVTNTDGDSLLFVATPVRASGKYSSSFTGVKIRVRKDGIEKKEYEQKKARFNLMDRYGSDNGIRIYNHEVWVGMTDEMARVSIGEPLDINRTITANHIKEQWVYYRKYLYFYDGKLSTIQEK